MVNFDALARVVRAAGGTALLPPHRAQQLVIGAFVLGDLPVPETTCRYGDSLAEGGPDDIFAVRRGLAAGGMLTLQQALAKLRTSRFDSQVFLELFPTLHERAAEAAGSDRTDLALAVRRVRQAWFPIGEAQDVALCLGVLLSRIGHHREALELFAESVEIRGANAAAHFASALAHHALRDLDQALKDVQESLAIDPTSDAARRLALELEAELGRDDGGAVLG
jgi:tetratricopeptide (TPR) repeat protein